MFEIVAGELRAKLGTVSAMRQLRSGRDTCAAAGPGRATSGRPTLQTSSNQRNSNHLTRTPVTNVVNPSQKTTIISEKALRLTTFVTTDQKSTQKTPRIDDVCNNTHQATRQRHSAAGVEGAEGTCRGAGGRRRGLAGLRDDAPSEARSADGSRAGRRPPAHTAAGPSGARNTREATSNTSGATSNRQPPQAQQSGPEPLGSGPPSMLSGDQRTTRVSSARPPCHPCRSSRR